MPTGTFTVSAVAYTFEVRSEEAGEDAGSDVSIQRIYGGDTSYIDLGGQAPVTRNMSLFFATASAFTLLKGVRGRSGTLVTDRDGTETAILQVVRRTKRNWDGATEASAVFIIQA